MKNYNNLKYTIGSLLYMQHFIDMFIPLCDYRHYMLKHSTLVMILHENMDEVDNIDDIEHMTKMTTLYMHDVDMV
jgi:hypothetical protein